jgi:Ca-activated chloride channel family protein
MEAMADPFRKGHHILQVGVQAKRFQPKERPPLHLTFLVDVSGSMSSPDKLGLAKESMHTLVSSMEDGDTVAMATYAGRVARVLEPTDVVRSSSIHRAIDGLHSGGSTAMSSGIDLAYEMADEAFERGAENRVVILSDGDANVGSSTWDEMLSQIKGYADQGVTLSTIGFGQGNYRDTLMEQLSNKGDGNNFYVDSQDESDRIFGEKIGGTMITVARDTKIQVEFNRDAVKAYRLIGYENRDIADKDFRNDRVDAGEVGSGHSVTALYEVILAKDAGDDLATVRLRWEKPGADSEATERSFAFASDKLNDSIRTASDSLKLAYGAATFAEVLRQSPHAAEVDLSELQEIVDGVATNKEGRELSRLIGMAQRLGAMDEQVAWLDKR